MKPGRELDKLVAEAMGYTSLKQGRLPGELYGHHPARSSSEDELRYVPHYSTDGKAAWEAWEWLEQNHPIIKNGKHSIALGRLRGKEALVYTEYGGEVDDIIATGETYPHAICLAVLATKEE